MASLPFHTVDVFTDTPYVGNPLAVVHIPHGTSITQAQRQLIAREFNLSETVFIHDDEHGSSEKVRISIHTTTQELPFAGHPTIGASFHILTTSNTTSTTLVTPAGEIPATYDPKTHLARLAVPHLISFPTPLARSRVAPLVGLGDTSNITPNSPTGEVATVLIVKGLGFALVRVASLEILGKGRPVSAQISASELGIDPETFIGFYLYCITGEDEATHTSTVQARLFFEGTYEDPATGSAASTLAAFLSMTKPSTANHAVETYEITSGIEMGRKSDIRVEVKPKDGKGEHSKVVDTMWLSGKAVEVMRGTLTI